MPENDHVAPVRAVYDAAAERYLEFVGTELSAATEGPIDLSLLSAFAELIAARPSARVADVGCGPGRVAAFLARQGLDVLGIDVSTALLARARVAHPAIAFEEGRLQDLPITDASLAGAVCWYSIIHTPPEGLAAVFAELSRVLEPGGHLLLAFQAGSGDAMHRADAHGTGLPLTSYRHGVAEVARRLQPAGFDMRATAERAPELDYETTRQAFVFARRA
jgi:ubiquinone/menaquinone biosynthesis C-methylase UbiE